MGRSRLVLTIRRVCRMQMLKCRFCMGKKACVDDGRKGINREGSLCSLSCVDDGEVEVYRRLRGGKITPLFLPAPQRQRINGRGW